MNDQQAALRKLAALRELGRHMSFWGVPKPFISEETEAERQRIDPYEILACLLVVVDSNSTLVSRMAAMMLIEFYLPDWRDIFPPALLGHAVGRDDVLAAQWRRAVLARDGHLCQRCGATGANHAHHLAHWAEHPALRLVVSNGLTLCASCHKAEHPNLAVMQ